MVMKRQIYQSPPIIAPRRNMRPIIETPEPQPAPAPLPTGTQPMPTGRRARPAADAGGPEHRRHQTPLPPAPQPVPSPEPNAPVELPAIPNPEMENTSVSRRLSGLLQKNSPLMQRAETVGKQASNRRGLMNSSMGVQAVETARLDAALPIASQEAQQALQTNLARMDMASREQLAQLDVESRERIANLNVAAAERQAASQLAANFESSYSQIISNIMANPELPRDVRQQLIRQAQTIRDSNLALVEQMYGIELEWETAPVTPTPDPTNLPPNLPPKPWWDYPVIESP